MRVLEIFYYRYFTKDGQQLFIGGIETYITHLCQLATSMGIRCRIFQVGDFMERTLAYAEVYALACKDKNPFPTLYEKAKALRTTNDRVLSVIANDTLIPMKSADKAPLIVSFFFLRLIIKAIMTIISIEVISNTSYKLQVNT